MSYQLLINALTGVAETILPTVKVYNGTLDQISRSSVRNDFPQIGIQEAFQMNQTKIGAPYTGTIIIDFFLQDFRDSTPQQTRNITASMAELSRQFLDVCKDYLPTLGIELSNIVTVPQYKRLANNMSGVSVQCGFVVSGCDSNVMPDLSEYMKEISRNVNPYEWTGIRSR